MSTLRLKQHILLSFVFAVLALLPSAVFGGELRLEQRELNDTGNIIIDLYAETDQNNPFNAASALISMPRNIFSIESISHSDSIFDLWTQAPEISRAGNEIRFSGGTTGRGGFIFDGKLLSFEIKPLHFGDALVEIENGELLAADGTGTNILENVKNLPYRHVRGSLAARFDHNRDGNVSLRELSIGLVRGK